MGAGLASRNEPPPSNPPFPRKGESKFAVCSCGLRLIRCVARLLPCLRTALPCCVKAGIAYTVLLAAPANHTPG